MAIIEDLIVSDYGAFVGLKGGRLRVQVAEKQPIEAPIMHLRSVHILTRSASFSAAALAACCDAGIAVHFLDAIEGNYASVFSSKLNTVIVTRRSQLEAISTKKGVAVARALAAGKLRSQATNLKYFARRQDEQTAKALKDAALELLAYSDQVASTTAEAVEDIRAVMMGIEGYCSRLYWGIVGKLIPEAYQWRGRTGRHATDTANILLNYGYGILYGEVQNALVIAGLEPYAGLIHTDRPGKPSLTCDMIEEFRAPIVDRTVIGLLNRNYEVKLDEQGRLERETRKNFAEHILSRFQAQGTLNGKRYTLRSIIQIQTRLLASAFRGERDYESYIGG